MSKQTLTQSDCKNQLGELWGDGHAWLPVVLLAQREGAGPLTCQVWRELVETQGHLEFFIFCAFLFVRLEENVEIEGQWDTGHIYYFFILLLLIFWKWCAATVDV